MAWCSFTYLLLPLGTGTCLWISARPRISFIPIFHLGWWERCSGSSVKSFLELIKEQLALLPPFGTGTLNVWLLPNISLEGTCWQIEVPFWLSGFSVELKKIWKMLNKSQACLWTSRVEYVWNPEESNKRTQRPWQRKKLEEGRSCWFQSWCGESSVPREKWTGEEQFHFQMHVFSCCHFDAGWWQIWRHLRGQKQNSNHF